jgi:hypothetical protein
LKRKFFATPGVIGCGIGFGLTNSKNANCALALKHKNKNNVCKINFFMRERLVVEKNRVIKMNNN